MPVEAIRRGSAAIPEVAGIMPPSSRQALDLAVEELRGHAAEWAALPLAERIALVEELRRDVARVSERWATLALQAKGIAPDDPAAGEEWITGPYLVLRNLRLLRRSLAAIAAHGRPRIPGPVSTRANGQVVARAFPSDVWDRLLYRGFTGEVWMQPGLTLEELPESQALAYREKGAGGSVVLVLGAGNISSIAPMDALYKLFVEKQVVLLKMNPVNAYLGPVIAEGFRALIARGFFHVVYGGAAEGEYLCRHEGVDEIHITGSDRTHDAIVFGKGEEGARRKAERRPVLVKKITSELGNVTPVIVVPGPWRDSDLALQAANVATQLMYNGGFNCVTSRVIVTWAGWPQRDAFLAALRKVLAAVPPRYAYYPGAEERYAAFLAKHPEGEQFGGRTADRLPWTLIPNLDPARDGDICFTTEAFCGIMGETPIAAPTIPEFVDRAVSFVNEIVWGTLAAGLIVHPRSLRDPEVRGGRARRGRPALRHGLAQPVGCGGVRPRRHSVGGLRGERHLRRAVGRRRGARHADVLAGPEDRLPGAVQGVADAAVVRHLPHRPPGRAAHRRLRGPALDLEAPWGHGRRCSRLTRVRA
ncbi:MAG: aldehyde dehydrogenase family protein [Thermoanaerobaculaceae bacterium]|nr:aldehyde dehydrogenase family protein [Thermoanaerobaculaceae bacterium]